MATARSAMSATVSSTRSVTTARRGTSASAASFVPNRIAFVSMVRASGSSVPSSPELRMSRSSSSSDRTDVSSSRGSMPNRRTVQLAAPFRNEITGPMIRSISTIAGTTA